MQLAHLECGRCVDRRLVHEAERERRVAEDRVRVDEQVVARAGAVGHDVRGKVPVGLGRGSPCRGRGAQP
eukprot:1568530-Prymnesium_polylepis.1